MARRSHKVTKAAQSSSTKYAFTFLVIFLLIHSDDELIRTTRPVIVIFAILRLLVIFGILLPAEESREESREESALTETTPRKVPYRYVRP